MLQLNSHTPFHSFKMTHEPLRSEKYALVVLRCDGHYKFAKNVTVQRGVDAAGSRDSRRMKKRVLYVALNEHNYEMKG
eukprot:Nk52_evm1s1238 gene=Nk52_evmTU1s1238